MRLSAPTLPIFVISLVLAVLALIQTLGVVSIPVVAGNAIWFALAGYVVLAIGNLLKGV
ncbi:MAG: hypothetical protein AAFX39_08545 [Pseudomonadota bacterium]